MRRLWLQNAGLTHIKVDDWIAKQKWRTQECESIWKTCNRHAEKAVQINTERAKRDWDWRGKDEGEGEIETGCTVDERANKIQLAAEKKNRQGCCHALLLIAKDHAVKDSASLTRALWHTDTHTLFESTFVRQNIYTSSLVSFAWKTPEVWVSWATSRQTHTNRHTGRQNKPDRGTLYKMTLKTDLQRNEPDREAEWDAERQGQFVISMRGSC